MLSPSAEPRTVFTHCPRCGRPSLGPHATYGFACADCSFLFFLNVAAAAAAIVRDEEGRVLLARRAHDPGAGQLDVPGGFIDYGETAEEALRRELREELSLEIDDPTYFCSVPNVYEFGGLNYRTLDVYFTARPRDLSTLRPADDIDGFVFVDLARFDVGQLAFDSVRRALALLRTTARPGPAAPTGGAGR
jgi:NAD+ diphosphatase